IEEAIVGDIDGISIEMVGLASKTSLIRDISIEIDGIEDVGDVTRGDELVGEEEVIDG
ncbi:hypothetical protein KI387_013551, partial [Taxus chinensis]